MTCKSSHWLLSVNSEVDPDIASLLGASAALAISGMPFLGLIGAARVGYKDGKYIRTPDRDPAVRSPKSSDLVVAGTAEGVLTWSSPRPRALDAGNDARRRGVLEHEQMQAAMEAINELVAEAGKPKWSVGRAGWGNTQLKSAVGAFAEKDLDRKSWTRSTEKQQRYTKIAEVKAKGDRRIGRGARSPKFTADQVSG